MRRVTFSQFFILHFFRIAYGIVFVVGVLGNIAVVLVVFKTTRMRSPTNQFIANLAIADLLVNFLCLPFTLIGNLFPGKLKNKIKEKPKTKK